MLIGAQLFTVRDACKTLDDFAETLKKVADIGYTTVQVSGTCPFEPDWLAAELRKNGLKCVITHTPPAKLLTDPVQVAKDHDVFDCQYVGLGSYDYWHGGTTEGFKAEYLPVAKALKENGKLFMYHNHAAEFQKENGILILDRMANDFAPDEMGFTLDTYWIQVGGGDPAQWIEKFSGRVPCIHLKDYAYGAKMAPIGEGNINFDRVFEKAESAGTKYMLVEQDDCYEDDPFDCLKRSYQYLTAQGLR